MSSLETEVGSGRSKAAASEAFAMATWWEAMTPEMGRVGIRVVAHGMTSWT